MKENNNLTTSTGSSINNIPMRDIFKAIAENGGNITVSEENFKSSLSVKVGCTGASFSRNGGGIRRSVSVTIPKKDSGR